MLASARFNKELDKDRKSRLPFLESQTRVAQTLNNTICLQPYQRLRKSHGYAVGYPLKSWAKRTRLLNEGNDTNTLFQQTHQVYLQLKANASNPSLANSAELNDSSGSVESFNNHHQFHHHNSSHHGYHNQYNHHHHHHHGYNYTNMHSMTKSSSMLGSFSNSSSSNLSHAVSQYDSFSFRYHQSSFRAAVESSTSSKELSEDTQRMSQHFDDDLDDPNDSDGSDYDDKKKKKKVFLL
jgi:hypothetical protein